MTLVEFADIIDVDIVIRREPRNYWIAGLDQVVMQKIKGVGEPHRCDGFGQSESAALEGLKMNIAGAWIIINAEDPLKRREFGCPKTLA